MAGEEEPSTERPPMRVEGKRGAALGDCAARNRGHPTGGVDAAELSLLDDTY